MSDTGMTRRSFLRGSTSLGIAGLFSSPSLVAHPAPSDGFGVLAVGVRGRGGRVGLQAGRFGRVIACCDVDSSSVDVFLEELAKQQPEKPRIYKDYREALQHDGVDLVVIGTPDHWHTPILIDTVEAGKDVYCEKPMTLTIEEGVRICRAVKKSERVVQVGTQQRSEYEQRFLKAVAMARSGLLGERLTARCYIGKGARGGPFPTEEPPKGLDWDFWLGPAPQIGYSEKRCHSSFRWWFEYSGGKMTDWGAHHIDIAQWALGVEKTGPDEIVAEGNLPLGRELTYELLTGKIEGVGALNRYNTATTFKVEFRYANGNRLEVREGPGNGIRIRGDSGELFVSRKMLVGPMVSDIEASESGSRWLEEEIIRLYRDSTPTRHMEDFIRCVKKRQEPISDVYTHHRSMTACHLANIALITGRTLRWDPVAQNFVNDPEASALLSRPGRSVYTT